MKSLEVSAHWLPTSGSSLAWEASFTLRAESDTPQVGQPSSRPQALQWDCPFSMIFSFLILWFFQCRGNTTDLDLKWPFHDSLVWQLLSLLYSKNNSNCVQNFMSIIFFFFFLREHAHTFYCWSVFFSLCYCLSRIPWILFKPPGFQNSLFAILRYLEKQKLSCVKDKNPQEEPHTWKAQFWSLGF